VQSRIDKPEKQAHWAQRSLCIGPTTCNRGYEREREKIYATGIIPAENRLKRV
jgi:hypothetical protein